MKVKHLPPIVTILLSVLVALLPSFAAAQTPRPLPKLVYTGFDNYEFEGVKYTRYTLSVINRAEYQEDLFQPSPDLPPCGLNKSSARSWVDIFTNTGKRLNGFCAFAGTEHLRSLWFALRRGEKPPSSVYIIVNDRLLNEKLQSNLAAIGAPEPKPAKVKKK